MDGMGLRDLYASLRNIQDTIVAICCNEVVNLSLYKSYKIRQKDVEAKIEELENASD